jgi:subtilisin-like proprotein convertase family protein/uncharacterized protein YvpB
MNEKLRFSRLRFATLRLTILRFLFLTAILLLLYLFLRSEQRQADMQFSLLFPARALAAGLAQSVPTATPSPTALPVRFTSLPALATSSAATLMAAQPLTQTETITPTVELTVTLGISPTLTPTPTPTPPPILYLPNVINQIFRTPTPTPPPGPPQLAIYCAYPSSGIPDDDPIGVSSSLTVADARLVQDVNVLVNIDHTWVGDLSARLTHEDTGQSVQLFNRPLMPATTGGCPYNDIGAILDDESSAPVENQCADTDYQAPAAISGIYLPDEPLSRFDGEGIAGTWTLNAADHGLHDTGKLRSWCLVATLNNGFVPTPVPPPPSFAPQAMITNISGKPQQLPLDCESRVAVDWARYFGVKIGELEFFNNLPVSDNPDAGFVGNVYGVWGQIPPYPYGVHAEPVAALLRAYGLSAYAHRPLSFDDLRAEVSAGRPVYVWVIGAANMNEIPIFYTSNDGHTTIVAHYEHVVNVIGYDASTVTILDGGVVKTRSTAQFLSSWSALGNMAITTQPEATTQ